MKSKPKTRVVEMVGAVSESVRYNVKSKMTARQKRIVGYIKRYGK